MACTGLAFGHKNGRHQPHPSEHRNARRVNSHPRSNLPRRRNAHAEVGPSTLSTPTPILLTSLLTGGGLELDADGHGCKSSLDPPHCSRRRRPLVPSVCGGRPPAQEAYFTHREDREEITTQAPHASLGTYRAGYFQRMGTQPKSSNPNAAHTIKVWNTRKARRTFAFLVFSKKKFDASTRAAELPAYNTCRHDKNAKGITTCTCLALFLHTVSPPTVTQIIPGASPKCNHFPCQFLNRSTWCFHHTSCCSDAACACVSGDDDFVFSFWFLCIAVSSS